MPIENPNFLKQKYWDKETFRDASQKSAKKKERLNKDEDVSISQKPKDQISAYVERIKRVAERKDPKTGKTGRLFLETSLYPKFIIKPENISDDYIKNILLGNFAEMKGYDREKLKNNEIKKQVLKMFEAETRTDFEVYQVPVEEKNQLIEQTVKDQIASLDRWFEYLTSPEAKNYPDEFKYWAFAEMLKLGAQDRDRQDFNKREENTAAPFPELNQQALALSLDEIKRKYAKEPSRIHLDDKDKQKDFQKRLLAENFGKLYGWSLDYINSLKLPTERLPITQGEWKVFKRGSESKILADTLQGFNTGWCIAGEGTAESYLNHSDILIYFSQDEKEQNTIPRAALVTDGTRVSEVRGIIQTKEVKQHLDDYIAPIVEEKLKTMPGDQSWQEGMQDMKQLAEIHFKHLQKQPLNKDELIFIYELDHQIQSMGYGQDPRIEEIRKQRNPREDAPVVFECELEEIAYDQNDITEKTKAYIGEWNVEIFKKVRNYPDIKHLFESFPDKKIFMQTLKTDPTINSAEKAEERLQEKNIYFSGYGKDILEKTEFSQESQKYELVRFTFGQLGFPNGATTDEIYQKAKELEMELCPAEVGPHLRLQYNGKEWMLIAMKQITDRGGDPNVFYLGWNGDQLGLHGRSARPALRWYPDDEFVFCYRKFET